MRKDLRQVKTNFDKSTPSILVRMLALDYAYVGSIFTGQTCCYASAYPAYSYILISLVNISLEKFPKTDTFTLNII